MESSSFRYLEFANLKKRHTLSGSVPDQPMHMAASASPRPTGAGYSTVPAGEPPSVLQPRAPHTQLDRMADTLSWQFLDVLAEMDPEIGLSPGPARYVSTDICAVTHAQTNGGYASQQQWPTSAGSTAAGGNHGLNYGHGDTFSALSSFFTTQDKSECHGSTLFSSATNTMLQAEWQAKTSAPFPREVFPADVVSPQLPQTSDIGPRFSPDADSRFCHAPSYVSPKPASLATTGRNLGRMQSQPLPIEQASPPQGHSQQGAGNNLPTMAPSDGGNAQASFFAALLSLEEAKRTQQSIIENFDLMETSSQPGPVHDNAHTESLRANFIANFPELCTSTLLQQQHLASTASRNDVEQPYRETPETSRPVAPRPPKLPRQSSSLPPSLPDASAASRQPRRRSDSDDGGDSRCQIASCGVDLSGEKAYCRRYKLCGRCINNNSLLVDGQEMRFCQQCSFLHSISAFDGVKRSCREKLHRHARRVRRSRAAAAAKKAGIATSAG